MQRPNPERFALPTLAALSDEIHRLGLQLPVDPDIAPLLQPVTFDASRAPNRLCAQPMEGNDGTVEGAPGDLTLRRYLHYAEGGFGLIWFEATAFEATGRSSPRQLWLHRETLPPFAALVRTVKRAARARWGHEPVMVLQLSHAGRYARPEGVADPVLAHHQPDLDRRQVIPEDYPLVTDEVLDQLQEAYAEAARLALEAGFDGVDIKACHGDLPADLLSAFTRPGKYGGTFENRTRFLREVVTRVKPVMGRAILASRFTVYDGVAFPYGFGTDADDNRKADPAEPVALAKILGALGVGLLNVTTGNPSAMESDPAEGALARLARQVEVTQAIQQAVPAIPVVGGGYSWLRQFMPHIAAGVLRRGGAAMIGLGRGALAYPNLPADLMRSGKLDPDQCCMDCSACVQLLKDGGLSGCVIRDADLYGEEYRHRRRFAMDHLADEARRCLQCSPAPCRSACPARIDVPGFLDAFAADRSEEAFSIIRRQNVLAEMCSHLCPVNRLCEGHCIHNTLSLNPIPIHDIQYAVCWLARRRGLTGIQVPAAETGRRVAVVGGGPAGVACAATLVERGHTVAIFERAERLGGTPEQLIRSSRLSGVREEVEALLQPALREGRLIFRFGCELGRGLSLADLRRDHDAVFLATGVWGERTLGRVDGVLDAVTFLREARAGNRETVPPKVILLAGGDSAMDSAVVARELGAQEVTVVYAGDLSEMHWHMPDSWFRTPGVLFVTRTEPLGYEVDGAGRMTGLKVRLETGVETVFGAGLVIEAMGLGPEPGLRAALADCVFGDRGLIRTASPQSYACGPAGVFAGGGLINGGASVVQCVAEGMGAGREIDGFLSRGSGV